MFQGQSVILDFLNTQIFYHGLVFTRLASILLIVPAFGSLYIPSQIRIIFAFVSTLLLTPVLQKYLPVPTEDLFSTVKIIALEILYGSFLGAVFLFTTVSYHIAAAVITQALGLNASLAFDPATNQQSSSITNFFSVIYTTLFFIMGLHHYIIYALIQSYIYLVPGGEIFMEDMLFEKLKILQKASLIGIQLASPFLLFSITIHSVMGILGKLSPRLQIFFLAIPIQIFLGLIVLSVAIGSLFILALQFSDEQLAPYVG